jgi:heavy metal sensor kinase
VSLIAFGVYTYFAVYNDLKSNLDASLRKVVTSLDYIIQKEKSQSGQKARVKRKKTDRFSLFRESEQMRFVGPLRPSLGNPPEENKPDIVWSAIYEHILLNPKNYYIQIADSTGKIVWRSRNLGQDSLPVFYSTPDFNLSDTAQIMKTDSLLSELADSDDGTVFSNIIINGEKVRLLVKTTKNAIISVGYVLSDIEQTMNKLFAIQMIAFPFILLVSVIGGLLLSKLSLRTIDEITRRADEISATNLSLRIPEVNSKDEVGHLTRTLNKMIERLDNSFSQIKKFTSDVSHELRTPLTILQGELEVALRKKKTPEEYEMVLVSALEEVARLTNVVETLLDLSRAERGQIKMNMKVGDLSKLVAGIVEDAEILAEAKGVTLHSNIDENVVLPFDGDRMHQAILNVIDNAIKYTPKGGSIYVELAKKAKTAEIIIRDTGIGIEKEELTHIFDRMYRVDKARSKNITGIGLGLSIVKWIIAGHKGKIEVDSIVNKGTTFKIILNL